MRAGDAFVHDYALLHGVQVGGGVQVAGPVLVRVEAGVGLGLRARASWRAP